MKKKCNPELVSGGNGNKVVGCECSRGIVRNVGCNGRLWKTRSVLMLYMYMCIYMNVRLCLNCVYGMYVVFGVLD